MRSRSFSTDSFLANAARSASDWAASLLTLISRWRSTASSSMTFSVEMRAFSTSCWVSRRVFSISPSLRAS